MVKNTPQPEWTHRVRSFWCPKINPLSNEMQEVSWQSRSRVDVYDINSVGPSLASLQSVMGHILLKLLSNFSSFSTFWEHALHTLLEGRHSPLLHLTLWTGGRLITWLVVTCRLNGEPSKNYEFWSRKKKLRWTHCSSCPYKHPQEPNSCGFRADSYPLWIYWTVSWINLLSYEYHHQANVGASC